MEQKDEDGDKDEEKKESEAETESFKSTPKEPLAPEQEDIFQYIEKEMDKEKRKPRPVPRVFPGSLTCALNVKPT